jgi:3-phenylpropionate/cinnamic acid dioxygenase small subunit
MRFHKDPDAILDYQIDWSDWLDQAEAIASYEIIPDDGITVDSDEIEDGVITVWLSGGLEGRVYSVTCRVTTDAGRVDDRSIIIICADK